MRLVKLVETIDIAEAYQFLQSPRAGAVAVFVGTVRNHSRGKEVIKLLFEAYESMAIKELEKVADRAANKWELENIVIIHATGEKQPGEPVVITGVASSHRKAAFEACEFLIDELKRRFPSGNMNIIPMAANGSTRIREELIV